MGKRDAQYIMMDPTCKYDDDPDRGMVDGTATLSR